ncbi:MAG: undecaprenyldiphospho-muramoylpentapeptide beta-N-acetylglucosaminyltransferase [Flavobacteriales bacterium]|nr:undecaprenyldiphospho-muramoylpentapeptide beta-N-acetylglucosaminyltransferase [Flavobacteriales bacterium]
MISGGGTGGHIFPAIAIANALKERDPQNEILFVGAEGRMEMQRIPDAGYEIIGLDIVGIQRRLTWKNLLVPFKLIKSLLKARKVIKKFNPDVAIGVGGYASGPLLRVASWMGIPTLIQEQNSYPGITNRLLAKKAHSICVAYAGMDRFFDGSKVKLTGNPVRSSLIGIDDRKGEALEYFKLRSEHPVVLIIGGSLGARSINHAISKAADEYCQAGIQVLWQTGKIYYEEMVEKLSEESGEWIHPVRFIDRMDLAYAAADVVVSRAGALSISELCLVGKAVILVPSPNVSEDHQTKNAQALVDNAAAELVKDHEVTPKLLELTKDLVENEPKRKALASSILRHARPQATQDIVSEVYRIISS